MDPTRLGYRPVLIANRSYSQIKSLDFNLPPSKLPAGNIFSRVSLSFCSQDGVPFQDPSPSPLPSLHHTGTPLPPPTGFDALLNIFIENWSAEKRLPRGHLGPTVDAETPSILPDKVDMFLAYATVPGYM